MRVNVGREKGESRAYQREKWIEKTQKTWPKMKGDNGGVVADWKYRTGEEDNRQTWVFGTGAKDYGIWDKAQGTHPE